MRLVLPDGDGKQKLKDPHLIQHLSKAVQWLSLLTSGKAGSMKENAETEGVNSSHVTRVINRTFLAPDILRAILHGKQPFHFNLKFLKQFRTLPTDWDEQRKLLGFAR